MNKLCSALFRSPLFLQSQYNLWKSCATVHTSAVRFERKFTEKHEWIDGDTGTVGLSKHAQEMLGEIVYVQLPDIGKQFTQMEEAAAVESVKAASDVYAPASGTVTEINETLTSQPNLINKSPHDAGWLFKMKLSTCRCQTSENNSLKWKKLSPLKV